MQHDTRFGFTPEQVDVIKKTIAPNTSDDELALFMMVCQKTGLDPFSRQIYLSSRKSKDPKTDQWVEKKSPETTIDGFRVIAERSGQYQGQLGPYWCGADGDWKDVWLSSEMPAAAKVGILRRDFKEPVWGVALFCEYVQTTRDGKPNSMWSKMGANQLAKCAESLGLRKAFPRDLSGMYTREEMQQADSERGSKEAQQDVAQNRIKELSAPKHGPGAMSPVAIPDPTYEQRHTALILEANEVLDAPAEMKPAAATKPKSIMSFAALKEWGDLKKELRTLTGADAIYYGALKAKGYDHANEIANKKDAADIWKVLATERTRMNGEADLKATLTDSRERIGGVKFMEILGANGCENITDALRLGGTPLSALLEELKVAIDDLQPKSA